jgi:regulator of RNase E activity RraA
MCSHGYTQIVELDVPVRVGGVWVSPGDLLHGDRNGVTTIPIELAELVIEGCVGFMAAEAVVLNYLRAGKVTAAGYVPARDEAKRQMAELGKTLRAKMPKPA